MGLASRGLRETSAGVERVGDTWALAQLKRQANEILAQAALLALTVTAIALLLPGPSA